VQQRIEAIADNVQNAHDTRASAVRRLDVPEGPLLRRATVSERP
jgi:hypothetical protein